MRPKNTCLESISKYNECLHIFWYLFTLKNQNYSSILEKVCFSEYLREVKRKLNLHEILNLQNIKLKTLKTGKNTRKKYVNTDYS